MGSGKHDLFYRNYIDRSEIRSSGVNHNIIHTKTKAGGIQQNPLHDNRSSLR